MAYQSSRLQYQLSLSRRMALQKDLQFSRAADIHRQADLQQFEYQRHVQLERLREQAQFRDYQTKRNAEIAAAEANLARERLYREDKQREYEVFVEAQRRSRVVRQEELEIQQRLLQDQQRKKSQFLAASRRAQLGKQIQLKEQKERQNSQVLAEQQQQQKLQKQLKAIDIEIGQTYDDRDERKKNELVQLQELDERIFKLRQDLRGSKVRQMALEEELLNISKLIK